MSLEFYSANKNIYSAKKLFSSETFMLSLVKSSYCLLRFVTFHAVCCNIVVLPTELRLAQLALDPSNSPAWDIPEQERRPSTKMPLFVKAIPVTRSQYQTEVSFDRLPLFFHFFFQVQQKVI